MRMARFFVLASGMLISAALPGAAQQSIDLTGTWSLQSSLTLPQVGKQAAPCVYSGEAVIQQDGSEIFGQVTQTLVSGPAECPAEMSASLSGAYNPLTKQIGLTGSLQGGQTFGTAVFGGEISREQGGGGRATVDSGPFAGTSGTWSAVLAQQQQEAIPVATPVGLTVLVLLMLAVGAALLRQQRPA